MDQPDNTVEQRSKHFGKIFIGTMHNFVKSISKDSGTSDSHTPPPETETSDKENEFELVDLPGNNGEPKVLLKAEAVLYLSKSVENLNTHLQYRQLKRNSSDTRLDERQPPTPLLVEVPPDTEDEPPHDLRTQNPALLNGTNLKHLSTSTPAMTAQGQLTEPPSPKATKDPKVHTTSKARQKKFLRHFPTVEEDEKVLNYYSCALIGDILLQGHLYITKNYFAFYSNVFGYVTKLLIPILSVEEITKEKTARIIPNAVGITTGEYKHIFGSLMSRDNTLAYMRTVWEKAKSEEALPEAEIIEPDPDSSESGESERESPVAEDEEVPPATEVLKRIRKESVRNQTDGSLLERKGSKGFVRTLKDAITEFRKLPRQSLILVATTLLLILLFLSAAVLLYRIHKIQNKYSISLQGASLSSTSEDIYSDLLQWQTHLHSRSADAVNNFLDSNLDQIAKVRQSLEALSALLIGQNAKQQQSSKEYVFRDDSGKVTLQGNSES
ncbi:GRAM domain-containing protein 2A-like isoform X5 [Euwallacea similis]|uniref:GRAM domain-containing protein 2A-like isoform X5 n=1 Tax=Euwallacea similis TaxID=1736056 RepID=UPI00344E817B